MLNAEERMKKAIIKLQGRQPFFSYLALYLKFQKAKKGDLPEFAGMGVSADGTLIYSEEFVDKLTDDEIIGVLCHEVLHLALIHLLRRRSREPTKWNIACFPKGEFVNTLNSFKEIQDLNMNDFVHNRMIDRKGKRTKLVRLNKRKYNGNLYTIKPQNIFPINATAEHPFLIFEDNKFIWKKAKDLNEKDYVIIPKIKPIFKNKQINLKSFIDYSKVFNNLSQARNIKLKIFKINKNTAYFLGSYVANGSKNSNLNGGINFSIGKHKKKEINNLKQIIKKEFPKYKISEVIKDNTYRLNINSQILSRALEDWCGRKAKNKKIPNFILFHKNKEILKAFLEGYIDGDGCRYKERIIFGTASKKLAFELQMAYVRLGILLPLIKRERGKRKIKEKILPPQTIYILQLSLKQGKNIKWKNFKDFIITPINNISKKQFKGDVYNFETQSHSYCVGNVAVHNCDLAVNTILKKNRFELPTGSLEADNNDCFELIGQHGLKKVEHISDKTAEELYDLLPDLKEKYVNGYDGKGNYGFDEHREGTAKTQGEKQKQENEWLKRIEEAYTSSKMRGQQPNGLERYIEELKKSQVNWRALLQKYLQALLPSDYTWARRSKKSMATNIYMPNILKEKISVVVLVDLSGSIGKKEMTEFLSEIIGLAKAFSQQIDMRLLTHDTKVHNDYKVSNGSIDKIKKLKLSGGGGTDFQEPLDYIERKRIKPECLVWLTDGYGSTIKKPKFPIIWILNPNSSDEYIKGTGTIIKLKETY